MYRTCRPLATSFFLGCNNGIVLSSPNVGMRAVLICLPLHLVYGGIVFAECGIRLYLNVASLTASSRKRRRGSFSQCCGGSFAWCRLARAGFISVWAILSAGAFSCGWCCVLFLYAIAYSAYVFKTVLDLNSNALSVR